MIALRFDKLYCKDRIAQPCYVSIPLAKGTLFDGNQIILIQNRKRLKKQTRVLSRYPDGSIRYLFLRFLANIPANKGTTVQCYLGEMAEKEVELFAEAVAERLGEAPAVDLHCKKTAGEMAGVDLHSKDISTDAQVPDLHCEQTDTGYCVDTGAMRFCVSNWSQHLFEELQVHGITYEKDQFVGPNLKLAGVDEVFTMQYGAWEVVEEGAVCAVLSNKGKLVPAGIDADEGTCAAEDDTADEGLLCEARVTAYAGRSYADVEVRLVNATDDAIEMEAYEFIYRTAGGKQQVEKAVMPGKEALTEETVGTAKIRTCVASSNYKTDFLISEDGDTIEKEITAEALLNQGNEHYAEVFYGTFFADVTTESGGVCATVYQAQQNFPKAVCASREGIIIKLVPQGATPVRVASGMAIAQQFELYFHEPEESLQDINHQTTMYQMPDRPILDTEVYEWSGLYPDIFVAKDKQNPDVECALMMTADNHTRSYGMMNWGDAPDGNYTAQGRGNGRLVWTNNEYDFPHACMLQFVRTGVRRFMDYCIVAGTHQMNVDVCHYSKDALLYGGQWEHTAGHCFGEMACSHEWVEGILDCYHLTGDVRFYDTAIGIGENILRLLETPIYQQNGGLNARETGWALRTLTALYKETYDEKWNVKSEWIVEQFKEWANRYGGWLAPYTDNVVIRVPFMISVAVGSLMRYYREFPREDVKQLILQAVDDMLENCMLDNGYFYYKELPSLQRIGNNPLVLEALAIGYELSGDKKYLEAGRKTFSANVSSAASGAGGGKRIVEDAVLVGNTGTKRFAQLFVPVVTYYKALADAGIH